MDFLKISCEEKKRGKVEKLEIFPSFIVKSSQDLMIRGGKFYAIWNEEAGLWSTSQDDAIDLIDRELDIYKEQHPEFIDATVKHLRNGDNKMIDKWKHYTESQLVDHFHPLDGKIIFANTPVNKKDYASKRLPYALADGDISAYDELISTLYDPEERHKIEWAIGSVVSGDSKDIQKFVVFYGSAGTGKSTILNIIQQLFDGYYTVFDAKALGSGSDSFALEPFKTNPLVAIQHDGDLSRIEDNTRLNSVVSHEMMTVNAKFEKLYSSRFHAMLFMGTNKPVKITDSRSGIIRRLIDVRPSNRILPFERYQVITEKIKFELGAIAKHCLDVYEAGKNAYANYIPLLMIGATNDVYNFLEERIDDYSDADFVNLGSAWPAYREYCEEAKVPYPLSKRLFKEELKNYFREFYERKHIGDKQMWNVYSGFRKDRFGYEAESKEVDEETKGWLDLREDIESIFDKMCAACPAQYATDEETPKYKWANVRTKLKDIDTHKLHYVKPPENHIVIDFDIKDSDGNKCFDRNIEEAEKWPKTYSEVSKSGGGIHLHYIYDGDVAELSRIYDDDIEIKVFSGNSSLRRKLSKCNDIPIATINSGLPKKGAKMVDFESVKNEKALRTLLQRNLEKEYHGSTKPSVDFIKKILDDAHSSGLDYDVSDLRPKILAFANNSTNQSAYCVKLVKDMKFCSKSNEKAVEDGFGVDAALVKEAPVQIDEIKFFDVEVFPNLLVVVHKSHHVDNIVKMINPSPVDIEDLLKYKLVGFNNRRYDNHILYARLLGYNNEQLYNLSQRIINGSKNAMFSSAYNLSYTDIYDFASAGNKMSLKKWEIKLGIHHLELGLPWDQPVPKELWSKVADYCVNDVISTEALFDHLKGDWTARQILAELSGLSVNDTTNQHTTKLIVGDDPHPQSNYIYTDLSEMFPGYTFERGVSKYRGEEVGEGGYVYAEPGMYGNVALLDIASMHPTSIEQLNMFGDIYTKRFSDLKNARIFIKHKDFDSAKKLFNGKLTPYLEDESTAKDLSGALKTAINSVYGLTSARFEHKLRDPRNIDNIVAKRGALFMVDLKYAVQEQGYRVAHIKTDSIKIPDADEKIIQFVMDFGKKYGYIFEHEATYDKMCLVNDAVYIARYLNRDGSVGDWTATGTQFAVPYVFKSLFSKDPIIFEDLCETKSVTSSLYLDMNERLPDVSEYEKELKKLRKHIKDTGVSSDIYDEQIEDLTSKIDAGHDYHFVGKVGSFCPIKKGCGGGLLLREKDGKYNAVGGTKGFRWLESEMVQELEKEKDIDKRYFTTLVDDAVAAISQYGDFEWFTAEEPYDGRFNDNRPF